MNDKLNKKLRSSSIGVGMLSAIALSAVANAESPFVLNDLGGGYAVADADMAKTKDAKCGEGKCGGKPAKAGDGKATEAKCGAAGKKADAADTKAKDAKCGEGKCGAKR